MEAYDLNQVALCKLQLVREFSVLSSLCSDQWPLGNFKFHLRHERSLLEAGPWDVDGTQVGVAVGHGFVGAGSGNHCQVRVGFQPQTGKLALTFLGVQTDLE